MSAACLLVGAAALTIASGGFDLSWTHSVEKTGWREHWEIGRDTLHLTRAAIKGSGAGMEPGDGAVLRDGWWEWDADLRVPELVLAASGATGAGWRLCDGAECRTLGAAPGDALRLAPCPADVGSFQPAER